MTSGLVAVGLLAGVAVVAGAAVTRSTIDVDGAISANSLEVPRLRIFDSLYEPSGVQQLPDGRIIVVEDEAETPFSIMSLNGDDGESTRPLRTASPLNVVLGKPRPPKLQDLEGLDVDNRGYVYAITSHSRNADGDREKKRERLARFRVDGDEMAEERVLKKLKRLMIDVDPALEDAASVEDVKDDNGFNIEGLSFDESKERLLIAFRSPVVDDKAVIVVMKNPIAAFDNDVSPQFEDEAIYLDLDKGGIRAIAFVPRLQGYLLVSRREDKNNKAFKLWLWDGNPGSTPRRVRISGGLKIPNAEGITPASFNGAERLLIVFDDGDREEHEAAHYLMLRYEQLEIDPRPEMGSDSK